MAIVKMQKFNLLAFKSDRQNLLDICQDFNYVHFNDLILDDNRSYLRESNNSVRRNELDSLLSKIDFCISTIKNFSKDSLDKDLKSLRSLSFDEVLKRGENFDFDLVYERLRKLTEDRSNKINKKNDLKSKAYDLTPWKNLEVDINELKKSDRFFITTGSVSGQFFDDLNRRIVEENLEDALVSKVSERDKLAYIIGLSSVKSKQKLIDILREFGYKEVNIKAKGLVVDSLNDLDKQGSSLKEDIKNIEEDIKSQVKYLDDLYVYDAYIANLKTKEMSEEYFLETDTMNVIEGYIPRDKQEKFKADLKKALGDNFILDIKEADKDDENVPIILKNNKLIDPYEEIIKTYALPKYNEIDPSFIVAIFYTIFTGFMIGDLGYGLLGVIGTILLLKFKNLSTSSEKMVRLFLRISISACVFGAIFGSFFGGIIKLPFGLIDPTKDINTLIVISLTIGAISLFTALGIKAFMLIRDKKPLDAVFDVGFVYMVVGGALALALKGSNIAKWIMIAGLVGIFLFSGRKEKSLGARIGSGAYEVYGLTSWIGDFVSFLRLMALVLSGAFVAYSVNLIVDMVGGGGIVGIIGAVLIFLVFQLFNMFLSYLSAYVHSLRLIYVEMFNKFYEGGGIKFREMINDTKFVKILKGGENE